MINYPNSFVMSAGESIYSMPRQLVQYAMSYNEGKTVPLLVLVEGYAVTGTMIGVVNSTRDYKVGDKTAWELLLSYNLPGNVDLLNPALTVTLPPYQTACGALDAISHLVEPFFFSDEATFGNLALHDHMQIGVIRAIYENLGKVLANPADLQLRGLMQWSATVGLNGWLTCGVQGWTPMHQMGHVLSSHFKATHGATLACMMVAWMRFFADRADNARFVKLATLLFGTDTLPAAADALEAYVRVVGVESRISQFGCTAADLDTLTDGLVRVSFGPDGRLASIPPIDRAQARRIYELAL